MELPKPESNWFYDFMRAIIIAFNKVYFRLEHFGAENTPKTGGVLVVANHASNLDPTTIACGLPRQVHFLAKEELFTGVLGKFLRKVNAHRLAKSGIDRTALRTCVELLKEGHLLMVFPEGSRTEDGNLLPPQPGSALIAIQSQSLILPTYIDGSLHAMPRGSKTIRPHKIRVFVGKPFSYDEDLDPTLIKKEQYARLSAKMMERIAELQELAGQKR